MSTSGTTPSYPGHRPSGNANDVRVYQTPQRTAEQQRTERTGASTTRTRTGSNALWWIVAAIGLAIILYFALRR